MPEAIAQQGLLNHQVRQLHAGMGQAVAERTVLRRKPDGSFETWGDVAERVATGNALLVPQTYEIEKVALQNHIAKATLLMSGRHLQHGDADQPNRNLEIFSNCLDGSTRILTMEYGPIELEKIVGQHVTVIAGDGVPRMARINEHGEQELFEVVFRQNTTGPRPGLMPRVLATANHRWPLANGEVTTELQVGHVIAAPTAIVDRDPIAVVHGLIFGDGSANKRRRDYGRPGVSQGRTYASIRVCKQDAVREEIHIILDKAGYHYSTPPHSDGDRVYYIGKFAHAKELPFSNDPEYVAGFIYGWWLADGSKSVNHAVEISTADSSAIEWLKTNAAFAGYTMTMIRVMERKDGDGSFVNGKPLNIVRLRQKLTMRVASITPVGSAKVYCPEEPVTSSFVLSNGLLTGNCSTAPLSSLLFLLLLNGSGVGRCYDDDFMTVDWNNAPNLRLIMSASHKDFAWGADEDARDARHKYRGETVHWHEVADSREGWAKAIEVWELMAAQKVYREHTLVLDFSKVRPRGAPIMGMQGRPASGPKPLMDALRNCATIKGAGMRPWMQALYIDHYLAECVLVGGARRAARMATKFWRDKNILDFVRVKRPIEYDGLTMDQVIALRAQATADGRTPPFAFLWSSNNSVTVDKSFWKHVTQARNILAAGKAHITGDDLKAWEVLNALTEAAYGDGTGEPGLINVDELRQNDEGWTGIEDGSYVGSDKYQVEDETRLVLARLAKLAKAKRFRMITNPCVTADTLVMTTQGPRPVTDLVGTSFAAVVDGKPYEATGFWSTGVKPVFKVKTARGYAVRATGNHEVLVEVDRRRRLDGTHNVTQAWKRVEDLVPGDLMVISDNSTVEVEDRSDHFMKGWALGQIKDDGGLEPSSQFKGATKNNVTDTTMVSSVVLEHLAGPCLSPQAKDLQVCLEKQSSAFVAGFLRGLFDADGSVQGDVEKGRSVRLAQSDLPTLEAVQRMLARLGIASSIYARREAGVRLMPDGKGGLADYAHRAQFEVVIAKDNIHRFETKIGFFEAAKKAALRELTAPGKREPYAERFTAEVLSVTADGEEEVFDCTVDEVHRFDANGLVVHNCGEISLLITGGYCVIADVVPFHADTLDEAEDAFRVATRALMRVNLMDSLYRKEVTRTNRIGVSMTGVHEFAWKFFQVGFRDLVNPDFTAYFEAFADPESARGAKFGTVRAAAFWLTLARFSRAVQDEAVGYAKFLGVAVPHTMTTIKPAGCASLGTEIKTVAGVISMRDLFGLHGVTEDTMQNMPDGTWIEPKVATTVFDEANVERQITKLYVNGVKPVFEITFEDGVIVKLTGNHKLKTADGWKRVDELTEGEEIIQY